MNDSLFDGDGGVGDPGDGGCGGWYCMIILIHHYYILCSNVNWNTAKPNYRTGNKHAKVKPNEQKYPTQVIAYIV
jgi:hypothetical protein